MDDELGDETVLEVFEPTGQSTIYNETLPSSETAAHISSSSLKDDDEGQQHQASTATTTSSSSSSSSSSTTIVIDFSDTAGGTKTQNGELTGATITPATVKSTNTANSEEIEDAFGTSYTPFHASSSSSSSSTAASSSSASSSYTLPKATDELDEEAAALEASKRASSSTRPALTADDDDEFDSEFSVDVTAPPPPSSSSSLSHHLVVESTLTVSAAPVLDLDTVVTTTSAAAGIAVTTALAPLTSSMDFASSSAAAPHTLQATATSTTTTTTADIGSDILRSLQSTLDNNSPTSADAAALPAAASTSSNSVTTTTTAPPPAPTVVVVGPPKGALISVAEAEDDDEENLDEDEEEEGEEREVKEKPTSGATTATTTIPTSSTHAAIAAVATTTTTTTTTDEEHDLEAEFNSVTAQRLLETRITPTKLQQQQQQQQQTLIPITYAECARFIFSDDEMLRFRSTIIATDSSNGSSSGNRNSSRSSCLARLFAVSMREGCIPCRDAVFCSAKAPYRADEGVHIRLMRTLYSALTGIPMPDGVSSWCDIGFQRDAEFITDLRGGGILGPLQMLYMIDTYPWLAKHLFTASTSPVRGFPLMATAINFTARTLQALRSGQLNRVCNRGYAIGTSSSGSGGSGTALSTTTTTSSSTMTSSNNNISNTTHNSNSTNNLSAALAVAFATTPRGIVTATVNDFYCALLQSFGKDYEAKNGSIQSIGIIMQSATESCLVSPERAIDVLKAENRKRLAMAQATSWQTYSSTVQQKADAATFSSRQLRVENASRGGSGSPTGGERVLMIGRTSSPIGRDVVDRRKAVAEAVAAATEVATAATRAQA